MLKSFFQKLFSVYPGEERNALIFAALGFVWSLAVTGGLKFADALFLLHVGAEHLPGMYTITSCSMIVLAMFLLYIYHHYPVNRIFLTAIAVGILFYLFAFFCVYTLTGTATGWFWYMLRIVGYLFFVVTLTCYWTFIDQYYPLQDAKRLYCLYSSVIFLGYAATGTVMRSGLVEIPIVTLAIAALLALTALLILLISRTVHPVHDESSAEEILATYKEKYSLFKLLKSILSSRFTVLLMTGNLLIYVLLVLTEYNYMYSFEQYFEPEGTTSFVGNEEDAPLTRYLGQWLAVVSFANIIFGLFLYSRIIRRFGIGSLIICTPLIWLVVFGGWSFSATLFFPILGIFVVEGTLNVVDDNNFNLLLNAIPSKIKNKTRVIIESFFEPVGMLLSSLLLAVPGLNSKYLGLGLAACLLIVTLLQRKQYTKAIYRNLAEHAVHFERSLSEWMTPERQKQLLSHVRKGDENTLFLAAKGVSAAGSESLKREFLQIVESNAPQNITALETYFDQLDKGVKTPFIIHSSASIKPLVQSSNHSLPAERRALEAAIVKFGSNAVPELLSILKDSSYHDKCRTLAGRVLGRLSLTELRNTLYSVVPREIDKAYFYYYHHHTLQDRFKQHDLSLLTDGLLTGYHSAMDFIIQLLGAAGELEDPELLSRALRSPHPKTRSQVMEALEKNCETKIFRLLQPLAMEVPDSEKIRYYSKLGDPSLSLEAVIERLSYSPSPIDQIIVAMIKQKLNFSGWREGLSKQLDDKDPLFQHFVMELLET